MRRSVETGRAEPVAFRGLFRDSHGRPVPDINIWSAETPETSWRIGHDSTIGGPALCVPVGRQGQGAPDFTKQAPDRQRRSMFGRRCQVCSEPGDLLILSSISTKAITFEGSQVVVLTEPWLCGACCHYATTVCPGLIRRSRDDDLTVIRPTRFKFGYSRGWVEGPLAEESIRLMPAMWAELHLAEAEEVLL